MFVQWSALTVRVAVTVALACSLALGASAPAAAYCRANVDTAPFGPCEEDPSVPRLRWSRGCIEYAFHPRFFERIASLTERQVRTDFEAAFAAYAEVDCGREPFEVRQASGTARTSTPEFVWDTPNESLVAMLGGEEWAELVGDPRAVAVTLLSFDADTGEIYDIDIVVNQDAGVFGQCEGACAGGEIDLRSAMTHEAGHYLGLGHSDVVNSTMAARAQPGNETATLEGDDRAGYCALDLPEPDEDDADCESPVFRRSEPDPEPESRPAAAAACATRAIPRSGASSGLTAIALLAALALWRARRRGRAQRPVNFGARFSRNAATPSR